MTSEPPLDGTAPAGEHDEEGRPAGAGGSAWPGADDASAPPGTDDISTPPGPHESSEPPEGDRARASYDEETEDDIDDDWDWDTELGLLDPGPWEPVRRPWVPAPPWEEPPPERDEQVAVVRPDDVGEFVRACRAAVRLSQRELAAAAGVPQSTVARLEAGRGSGEGVRLATLCRLADACGISLVGVFGGVDGSDVAPPLRTDLAQRHRDAGDRMLPAHLRNRPLRRVQGAWWGDDRYTHRRARPRRTYERRHRYSLLYGPVEPPENPPRPWDPGPTTSP